MEFAEVKSSIVGACLLATFAAQAATIYGPYTAEVVKVKNGDTVLVDIAVWPGLTQRVIFRLAGVSTPEKRGRGVSECEKQAGQKATNFTTQWLKDAAAVVILDVKLGKYAGRAVGRIELNGKDLGKALLEAGHARPHSGGRREPWC